MQLTRMFALQISGSDSDLAEYAVHFPVSLRDRRLARSDRGAYDIERIATRPRRSLEINNLKQKDFYGIKTSFAFEVRPAATGA